MKNGALLSKFQVAQKDNTLAVIEGVQALKHAVRFKAELVKIITCDLEMLTELLKELAPDILAQVLDTVEVVDADLFDQLSSRPIRTKVIALAKRRCYQLAEISPDRPVVVLENPKDLDNVGAVVRVASAADSAAVITIGDSNIWHPLAIRGGAGLQFATPVFSFKSFDLKSLNRPVIAMDPTGDSIEKQILPKNSVFVFGTERHGIQKQTLNDADRILRLSMKSGVSSMNLATSVAATLYCKNT